MQIFKKLFSYFRVFFWIIIIWVNPTPTTYNSPFVLWSVSPLEKIFPDTPVAEAARLQVEMSCARNEYEPGQFAIYAKSDLTNVTIQLKELTHESNNYAIPTDNLQWNFVGFVPIQCNTPDAPKDGLVRQAPGLFPDPLLEERKMDIAAGKTQPVWLTVFVPKDAPAGDYTGKVIVSTKKGKKELPIKLHVYSFTLPDERHLFISHWLWGLSVAEYYKVIPWSEEHWKILERYAKNMAMHRRNVAYTSIWLIKIYSEQNKRLTYDFSIFDRWVKLFEKVGAADRIEISPPAHTYQWDWRSKKVVWWDMEAIDRKTGNTINLIPERNWPRLLTQLEEHLKQKGWLKKSFIHVSDEPSVRNVQSWKQFSRAIKRAAPGLKHIDATETTGLDGHLNVWVIKPNNFIENYNYYTAVQKKKGNELWFYTCINPKGEYPNRFIDYPLIKVRLMHWFNWRYKLSGYLHYGFNRWTKNPFADTEEGAPAGDRFIIYPGKDGPINSIRWEMSRESIEDYEYLWLLANSKSNVQSKSNPMSENDCPTQPPTPFGKGNPSSDELCRMLVKSFTNYTTDPAELYRVRDLIAAEIMKKNPEDTYINQ
jgi:hypothetical protein